MSTTNNRLTAEELQKLRQTDFSKKQGFVKAETVLGKEVGEVGTPERAEFDAKARAWYYGEMLRERRNLPSVSGGNAPTSIVSRKARPICNSPRLSVSPRLWELCFALM